jgi:hypothetical protein
MPPVEDEQVNGPSVMDCPYRSVGVPVPAFARHCCPVHSVSVLSSLRVTDRGGVRVRQNVDVTALGPRLSSSSQLMFPEGDRNSDWVGVCGASVPIVVVVDGAVDVEEVFGAAADVVVARDEAVVGVVDGPLEHAANPSAKLRRSTRGVNRLTGKDGFIHAE